MANSLLAHMYSRIRGSQEDVATIALQYIISSSDDLNKAFTQLLESHLRTKLPQNLQYSCQSVGEEKERPDLSGVNQNGTEVLLCEMKFYAGLTANQPLGYIDRLKKNGGTGLVFICPNARLIRLWAKLKELCSDREVSNLSEKCICVDGIHLTILSWSEIIDRLNTVASATSSVLQSDIHQLQGFCEQMDSDAFIPFTQEELSSDNAAKMERYYSVIDGVYDLLYADPQLTTESFGKASTYRTGLEKKLMVDGIAVYITFDCAMWKSNKSEDTPFWTAIGDYDFQHQDDFQRMLRAIDDSKKEDSVWSLVYFPLESPTDATYDEICSELKQQILNHLNYVRSHVKVQ